MPRPSLIAARNHWCLHNDQLAQDFDGILNLTQTFPGCAKSPEGSIFYAPLSSNLDELVAGLPATFDRPLEALYEPTPGQWAIAADGVPRFESGALLMEPASTNKTTCYSFPDAGLTNYSVTANGDMTRELGQPDALAGIGNGYCVRLVGARGTARIDVGGLTGNTNTHTYWAYCRKIAGTGQARLQSLVSGGVEFTNSDWEIVTFTQAPAGTTDRISLYCAPNVSAEFVFPNLKEETVLSTPIITRGASASRSRDVLYYPGVNSVFNQSQGMAAIDWTPKHTQAETPGTTSLMTLQDEVNVLYYNESNDNLSSFEGVNTTTVVVDPFTTGTLLRSVVIYGPPGTGADRFSVGVYQGGAYDWDTNNARTYAGPFPAAADELRLALNAPAPCLIQNAALWGENKGRAWIEANYSP